MKAYKYKAFISYSHADTRIGAWLHRRLENYAIPKHIVGRQTALGPVPPRLRPIFRDREDLAAAGDLGSTIEAALAKSENLIVVCSPQAAKSHWVNQEVLFFKRQNRGANIFAVILSGEPYSGGEDECLPPALRFDVDADGALSDTPAEPLAADLRGLGDGKRLGVLKLIAGMVGVGLDELVQRDLQKRNRRVTAITAASLASVLVMGALTYTALDARKDAEARTQDAERLTDFMMGDLRDRLEPVGRLDALASVSDAVLSYYEEKPESDLSCDALGRKARAMYVKTGISINRNDLETAKKFTTLAVESLNKNAIGCKGNNEFLFDRVYATQWAGLILQMQIEKEIVVPNMEHYRPVIQKYKDSLTILESINASIPPQKYRLEVALADNHILLGKIYLNTGEYKAAKQELLAGRQKTQPYYELAWNRLEAKQILAADDAKTLDKHADVLTWLASVAENTGDLDEAFSIVEQYTPIYHAVAYSQSEVDWVGVRAFLGARYAKYRILGKQGRYQDCLDIISKLAKESEHLVKNDPDNESWGEFHKTVEQSYLKVQKHIKNLQP